MPTEEAKRKRLLIEKAVQSLDPREASEMVCFHPPMRYTGKELPAHTRIQWDGKLLISTVPLWDTEQYDPAHAPDCWQELPYRDGIRIIPKTITVTDAFGRGERGWWRESVYESKVDSNVYTPDQYPDNWEFVK